ANKDSVLAQQREPVVGLPKLSTSGAPDADSSRRSRPTVEGSWERGLLKTGCWRPHASVPCTVRIPSATPFERAATAFPVWSFLAVALPAPVRSAARHSADSSPSSLLLRLRQHYDGAVARPRCTRTSTNSAAHRQKHRIFCALLCLAPHLA
uniref:Integron gene cassette protein n=1 Tax=Macrostomum lignano TaxID=282301 RepID=A0A1I8F8M4_9PLAT